MNKKVTIKEEDIEAPPEETLEEIVEQVKAPAPTPAPQEPQKADTRMRVRELYKCDLCGKYLTKKSLNYSHFKTCRGNPENQTKAPKEPPPQADPPPPYEEPAPAPPPPQQVPQYVQPQVPIYEQMRAKGGRRRSASFSGESGQAAFEGAQARQRLTIPTSVGGGDAT